MMRRWLTPGLTRRVGSSVGCQWQRARAMTEPLIRTTERVDDMPR